MKRIEERKIELKEEWKKRRSCTCRPNLREACSECPDDSEDLKFWLDIIERELKGKVNVEEVIKYIRSGEVAGSFADGCDCSDCDKYEKKVRKDILSLPSLGAEGLEDNQDEHGKSD